MTQFQILTVDNNSFKFDCRNIKFTVHPTRFIHQRPYAWGGLWSAPTMRPSRSKFRRGKPSRSRLSESNPISSRYLAASTAVTSPCDLSFRNFCRHSLIRLTHISSNAIVLPKNVTPHLRLICQIDKIVKQKGFAPSCTFDPAQDTGIQSL